MTSLLDRFLLALCVYRESRGESLFGQQLVAKVILNRANDVHQRWPRTIRDVILQPMQFSSFNPSDSNVSVYPHDDDVWKRCVAAADVVLAGGLSEVGANHYHTLDVHPAWSNGITPDITEGHHVFYEL